MHRQEKIETSLKRAPGEAMHTAMQLPHFEIPNFMAYALPPGFRALAENSVMQGKETLDTLGAAAENAYSASAKSLNEFGTKVVEAGRSNAHAAFDCCRDLLAARTQSQLLEVWSTHAQRQFDEMFARNWEIWSLTWKVAASQPTMTGIAWTTGRSGQG